MSRYLIKSHHTAEDCSLAVKHFREYHAGFLTHFEWGCFDNDHTAYAMLEADNHDQALLSVPPLLRPKAEAVKLAHFKLDKVADPAHEKAK